MITDFLLYFSDKQALSASKESDFTIDFLQVKPSTGADVKDLHIVVAVAEDVAGTLGVSVETSDKETTGFTAVSTSETVTAPKQGTQIVLPIPRRHKRYLRLKYVGSPTSGKVTACIAAGLQDNVAPYEWVGR